MIVSIKNSLRKDMPLVLDRIAKGESFGIWFGPSRELPDNLVVKGTRWEGKASLRIKVGKRRKLVVGTISYDYETDRSEWVEMCNVIFTPKPRVFKKMQ